MFCTIASQKEFTHENFLLFFWHAFTDRVCLIGVFGVWNGHFSCIRYQLEPFFIFFYIFSQNEALSDFFSKEFFFCIFCNVSHISMYQKKRIGHENILLFFWIWFWIEFYIWVWSGCCLYISQVDGVSSSYKFQKNWTKKLGSQARETICDIFSLSCSQLKYDFSILWKKKLFFSFVF